MRLIPLCCLLGLLYACSNDLPPGAMRIQLDGQLHNAGSPAFHAYWTVADPGAWEATLAAADTSYAEGDYRKFRSGGIWYEYVLDGGVVKSQWRYPGFERQMDSVMTDKTVVYANHWQQLLADVPSAEIALNGDSLGIAVVHIEDRAFPWQLFDFDTSDYLLLTPVGQDSFPITLDLDNVGTITGRTIFRVGRHYYGLRSLSDDRREMVIEPLDHARDLPVNASLDLSHRKISVNTPAGEPHYLKSRKGHELAIFFTTPYPGAAAGLAALDSTYRALPPARREALDLAVIMRYASPEEIGPMLDSLELSIPLFLDNEKTCLRLHCRPHLPYYIEIDELGRYRTFWGRANDLEAKLATAGAT